MQKTQKQLPPNFDSSTLAENQPLVRTLLTATRIVWQTGNIQNAQQILVPDNGQADLSGANLIVMTSDSTTKPAILLDFGKEIHGGIQIVTGQSASGQPINLHLHFGESVSEAMSEIGEKNATNDHAMRDYVIAVPWLGKVEVGNTGFRFVRIELSDLNTEFKLKGVRAIFSYRDIPYLGSFNCSDDTLNQIWQTGAYTVHLNMQEFLTDGNKRDSLVWMGDMHPEVCTLTSVFGANEVVPKSLDQVRDITPLPGNYMNGIISYSMWWVLIQNEWYMKSGDLDYLTQQKDYLLLLLNHLASKIGDDNKEHLDDGSRFLDWPSSDNTLGVDAALQALLLITLNTGSQLCTILNESATATVCTDGVAKLKQYVPDPNGLKQAASLLILADMVDAETMNEQVISLGGVHGYSTFFGYYMLQAKAKAGDYQGALDAIRNYWGKMIEVGATTFWEDFNVDWLPNASRIDELVPEGKKDIHGDYGAYCYKGFRHSLCHGWASGPTSWLTEHVLGIQVMSPGCKTIKVSPNLGDLTSAEGTFPTPLGVVTVKHVKQPDGKIQTNVDAPPGIQILSSDSAKITQSKAKTISPSADSLISDLYSVHTQLSSLQNKVKMTPYFTKGKTVCKKSSFNDIIYDKNGQRTEKGDVISFGVTFKNKPIVAVSLIDLSTNNIVDPNQDINLLLNVWASDISQKDFRVSACALKEVKISGYEINWIATGEV